MWSHLIESAAGPEEDVPYLPVFRQLLSRGTLAGRLLKAAGAEPGREKLREIYTELAGCLADGRLFLP